MTNTQKLFIIPALALVVLGGGAAAGYAHLASADTAETGDKTAFHMKRGHGPGHGTHGVMGEVTAVNGSTLTVTGRDGQSYTVTADTAEVVRHVTGTLSDIQVGDRVGVHGEVSGTTVTAKRIMDDVPAPPAPPAE